MYSECRRDTTVLLLSLRYKFLLDISMNQITYSDWCSLYFCVMLPRSNLQSRDNLATIVVPLSRMSIARKWLSAYEQAFHLIDAASLSQHRHPPYGVELLTQKNLPQAAVGLTQADRQVRHLRDSVRAGFSPCSRCLVVDPLLNLLYSLYQGNDKKEQA